MSQITLSNIVTLINGIIQHGNHSHTEYTPEEFAALQKMADDGGQIEDYAQELIDLYEEINNSSEDFTIDFDGNEYRIIKEAAIWCIYVENIQETVLDCYGLDKIPDFVEIDWEQTAKIVTLTIMVTSSRHMTTKKAKPEASGFSALTN